MRRLRNNGELPQNVARGLRRRSLGPETLMGMWLWPLGPMTSESAWGIKVSSKLANPGVLWLVSGNEKFGGNHLVDHRPIPSTEAFPGCVCLGEHDRAIQWMTRLLDTLHPTLLGAAPSEYLFRANFDGRHSEPDDVYIDGDVESYYLYFPVGGGKLAQIVTSTDGMIITAKVGIEKFDKGQGIVWEPLGHAKIDNRDKTWVRSERFTW